MIAMILSTDHAIMPEAMARSNELTIRPGAPAIGHDPIRGSGNQPGIMNRRDIVAQDLPQDLKAMVRQAHQGHTASSGSGARITNPACSSTPNQRSPVVGGEALARQALVTLTDLS